MVADRVRRERRGVNPTRLDHHVHVGLTPRRSPAWRKQPFNETRTDLTVHLERAVLVSVALPNRSWNGNDPLDELRGLAETARANIVGELTQKRQTVVPGTYIGKGKLAELTELCEAKDAEVV